MNLSPLWAQWGLQSAPMDWVSRSLYAMCNRTGPVTHCNRTCPTVPTAQLVSIKWNILFGPRIIYKLQLKGKKSKLTTCIFFILAVFILVSWLLTVADLISPTLKQIIKLTTVSRLLNVNQPKNSKLTTVSRQLNAIHSKKH